MSEGYRGYRPNDSEITTPQYGGQEDYLDLRRGVYEDVTSPLEKESILFYSLGLKPSDTIADIGCADGKLLHGLRQNGEFTGQMIGVDIYEKKLQKGRQTADETDAEIDYVAATAEDLPLKDSSVDSLLCLFVLYHVTDQDKALAEFKRVVKPGGRIVIATSGSRNKQKQRQIEAQLADYLQVNRPPIFNEGFNIETARQVLPDWFDRYSEKKHSTNIVVNNNRSLADYVYSLHSMRVSFDPVPNPKAWDKAIKKIVEPMVTEEMDREGRFTDVVEQSYFSCINDK